MNRKNRFDREKESEEKLKLKSHSDRHIQFDAFQITRFSHVIHCDFQSCNHFLCVYSRFLCKKKKHKKMNYLWIMSNIFFFFVGFLSLFFGSTQWIKDINIHVHMYNIKSFVNGTQYIYIWIINRKDIEISR